MCCGKKSEVVDFEGCGCRCGWWMDRDGKARRVGGIYGQVGEGCRP